MRLLRAASDASTQLVQLRKAKAFGVFDDHDGCVGNVDTDFDDGGGDKDLRFVFAEGLHDGFFFFAGQASVQQAEFEFWENLF